MRLLRLATVFVALAAASIPARAQSIAEFVGDIDQSMRSIAREGGNPARRCRALLNRVMDIDFMAMQAVTPAVYQRMTGNQRAQYRSAFERRMAARCVNSVPQFTNQNMTLVGVRNSGQEQLAATRMSGGGDQLTWRLRRGGGQGFRAIDVVVDGRSSLISAREEYAAILNSNQGNIDALIAFLHK